MMPTYIHKVYALLIATAISTATLSAQQTTPAAAVPGAFPPEPAVVPGAFPPGLAVVPDTLPPSTPAPAAIPPAPAARERGAAPLPIDSLAAAAISSLKPRSFKPNPIRSQWVAMVLPGGGQIYNRKYWKLPILYGGFLGCAYALTWNGQMLRDYSQAYLDITDADPNTKSYEKMLPLGYDISGREERFQEIFKNKKNFYRKYRDLSILAFALVYVIGVIDAYVDAELSTFDISRDLSLHMSPAVISTDPRAGTHATPPSTFGVALTLGF